MPEVRRLDHLVLTVRNIDRSVAFYSQVMGMSAEAFTPSDGTRRMALKFGQQKINLHQAGDEFRPHAAHPGTGSADLCFLTDMPLPDWQTHLAEFHVNIEEGPVMRTGATGPIQSIYVRDPDGNLIEISTPLT